MTQRLLPLVLLLLLVSLPAIAQPTNNEVAVSYGRSDFVDLGNSRAFGFSYARYWKHGFAVRLGIHRSQKDFPDNQGEKSAGAYYATAEYHLFRGRLVSPYVGGGVAYGTARMHLSHGFTGKDSDISGFGDAGVDVNVTPRFAISADVSYMRFDPDLGDRHGSRLDPITTLVSLKYRY